MQNVCHRLTDDLTAARLVDCAGLYVINSSLELLMLHQPLGVSAIETMVEALDDNTEANQVIDQDAAKQRQIAGFAYQNIRHFGPAEDFLGILANISCDVLSGSESRHPAQAQCIVFRAPRLFCF